MLPQKGVPLNLLQGGSFFWIGLENLQDKGLDMSGEIGVKSNVAIQNRPQLAFAGVTLEGLNIMT